MVQPMGKTQHRPEICIARIEQPLTGTEHQTSNRWTRREARSVSVQERAVRDIPTSFPGKEIKHLGGVGPEKHGRRGQRTYYVDRALVPRSRAPLASSEMAQQAPEYQIIFLHTWRATGRGVVSASKYLAVRTDTWECYCACNTVKAVTGPHT